MNVFQLAMRTILKDRELRFTTLIPDRNHGILSATDA
jgi:hypothetical protein